MIDFLRSKGNFNEKIFRQIFKLEQTGNLSLKYFFPPPLNGGAESQTRLVIFLEKVILLVMPAYRRRTDLMYAILYVSIFKRANCLFCLTQSNYSTSKEVDFVHR